MKGEKLLLMGSSAFKAEGLPREVRDRIDDAMAEKMTVIVGEAPGANRFFQDYLKSKGYGKHDRERIFTLLKRSFIVFQSFL